VIPVANATLTAIIGPGTSADWDVPATAGTARWQGRHAAYVVDELVRDPGTRATVHAHEVTEIRKTSVVINARLARLVKQGDKLQFTYQDTSQERTAANVRITEITGTARIVLENT
jgi:hypothetical protein